MEGMQGLPMFIPLPPGLEELGPCPGLANTQALRTHQNGGARWMATQRPPVPNFNIGDFLLAACHSHQLPMPHMEQMQYVQPALPNNLQASILSLLDSFYEPSAPGLPAPVQDVHPARAARVDVKETKSVLESTKTWGVMESEMDVSEPWGLPQGQDDSEIEKLLEPILRDMLGLNATGTKCRGKAQAAGNNAGVRWWTRPQMPLLCPLTRFPVCLLPYPPFKLRIDPKRSSPHRLVDGKFLALQIIVTGRFVACGRELQASDISALDDHIHRCKLGPHRPGRAASLAREALEAELIEQRARAAEELECCVAAARAELGKLRRIQENRLIQIRKALGPQTAAIIKPERSMSSLSNASTSPPSTPDLRVRNSSYTNLSTYSGASTPPYYCDL